MTALPPCAPESLFSTRAACALPHGRVKSIVRALQTRGKRSSGALLALSLAEAAERGDIRCVELKIKAGEDINKATKRTQWTPLHKASAK